MLSVGPAVGRLGRARAAWPSALDARIMLAFVLIGILPVAVVGVWGAMAARAAIAEQSARELNGLARGLAGHLDTRIATTMDQARAIAALPDVVGMDPARQDVVLRELYQQLPGVSRVSTFDIRGQRLATSHDGGATLVGVRESFQDAVRLGRLAWEVAPSISSGRESLLINTPIRDADRRVVGVVGVVVDLANLSSVVAAVPIAGGGCAFVLGPDGRLILHPDPVAVQQRRDYAWLGVPEAGRPAGPGTIHYAFDGEAHVAGYAPLLGLPWTVVAAQPQAEALRPADWHWRVALGGLLASAAAALLAARLVAWRLTRELRAVAAAARALRRGEADAVLPPLSAEHGEVGALVESFDAMRTTVAARERALRASEARFRSLFAANPQPVVVYERGSARILEVNDAAAGLYGYPRERMIGMPVSELGMDEPIPADGGAGTAVRREQRHRRRDGSVALVEVSALALEFAGREAVLAVAEDVTERRESDRRLRETDERLRMVVDALQIVAYQVDAAGTLLMARGQGLARLGLTPEGAVGGSVLELYRQAPALAESVRTALAGQPSHVEAEVGGATWLAVHVPVLAPDGRVDGAFGTALDVTERARAAAALRDAERRAMAADKFSALGRLAGGVAHDLNQSLTLIAGHAEIAAGELGVDPELTAHLDVIVRAAMDGAETVDRLLRFARSDADAPSEAVDLAQVVGQVAELTAPHWRDAAQREGRPIGLRVVADGRVTIQGRAAALREMLVNMVLNAVDALPRGGAIELRTRVEADRAVVEVADTGVGMTPDVQRRVFEPFFTTKGERGTGLGLAQVFGIAEAHGATVTVNSTPGAGTTFRVDFPALATGLAAPTSPQPRPTGSRRVLVVDDEPRLAAVVARVLTDAGHAVAVVASAADALRWLDGNEADVVVTDLGLGDGPNGLQLAQDMRARRPALRIVLLTGWSASLDPEDVRGMGIAAVLGKPFRPDELVRAIGA